MGTSAALGPPSILKGNLGPSCPCQGLTSVEHGIQAGVTSLPSSVPTLPRHGRLPAVFSLVWVLIW